MSKYAAAVINAKYDEEDRPHIRRVLVEYSGESVVEAQYGMHVKYYEGTRLVFLDPYFLDESSSHQYMFGDSGYVLLKARNGNALLYAMKPELFFDERQYHTYLDHEWYGDLSMEFEAASDDEAIEIFNGREELR